MKNLFFISSIKTNQFIFILTFLSFFFLIEFNSFAQQLTQGITYQGKLIENGQPFTGSQTIFFELIDNTGNIPWSETQTVNIQDGLYSVVLGNQIPLPSIIFSANPNLNLRVTINGNVLSPNVSLRATPYAHTAGGIIRNSIGTLQIINSTILPIDIASGGNDKLLGTNLNGRVVWLDRATAVAPTGTAGGDLTGAYPNPEIGTDKVDSDNILDGTIIDIDVDANAAIAGTKINPDFDTQDIITTGDIEGDELNLTGDANIDGEVTILGDVSIDADLEVDGDVVIGGKATSDQTLNGDVGNTLTTKDYVDNQVSTATQVDGTTIDLNGSSQLEVIDDAITTGKIADGTITTVDLADNSVTTLKINADAVTTGKIADGTITTVDLADNSVTTLKINADAVTTGKIADGTITTVDLADNSVTTLKINADAVTTGKIADGTVATVDLADNSVTTLKINADAVTSAKILDGTVATADLVNDAVTTDKLGTAGATDANKIFTTNATGDPVLVDQNTFSVTPNGTAGGDLTGTYPNPTIGTNAITTGKIADGTITTVDLADNAVTTLKINDDVVTLNKLQNGTANQVFVTDAAGNPILIDQTTLATATNTDNQTLSIGTGTLDIFGGNNVTLASLNIGQQNLSLGTATATQRIVNIANGIGVTIDIQDADADITNEIQDLTLATDILFITNDPTPTNTIDLTPYRQNLLMSGNQIQISGGGNTNLSFNPPMINGEVLTWSQTNNRWEAITPATFTNTDNQALSLVGSTLSLTNGGTANLSTITLNSFATPTTSINFGNQLLTGVANPSSGTDVATKDYVDNAYTAGVGISIDASRIITSDDSDPSNEIQNISIFGNAIGITGGGTGFNLTPIAPANNQVLTWNAGTTRWEAQNIPLSPFTISGDIVYRSNNANDKFIIGSTQMNFVSGTDNRMFYDKSNGAFRVGGTTATQWDIRGSFSFAAGQNTSAEGTNSTVSGGIANAASASFSTIGGGVNNQIPAPTGLYATIAGGSGGRANGQYSFIGGGDDNQAIGEYSSILGGIENRAESYGETTLGIFSNPLGSAFSPTTFNANDRLLIVGNGVSALSRSNAMILYKDATLELKDFGLTSPSNSAGRLYVEAGKLHFNGSELANAYIANNGLTLFGGNQFRLGGAIGTGTELKRVGGSSVIAHPKLFSIVETSATNTDYTLFVEGGIESDDVLYLKSTSGNATKHIINAENSSGNSAMLLFDNGNATFTGIVSASSFNPPSDIRYKKEILTLNNSLSTIQKLRGTSYYWKDQEKRGKKWQFGVIAQEIEKVFPNLVMTDSEGYKSVNYIGIVPILIEATKEQQTIIEAQEERIIKLEKQVQELKELVLLLKDDNDSNSTLAKKVDALEKQLTNLVNQLSELTAQK